MEIKVKPIKGRPQLTKLFIEIMEDTCPIWAWDQKQQLKRKKMRL